MISLKRNDATSLSPVISVDPEKCVNCHMCIAVCPVKYCIDGSGDKVSINSDLCIGCGNCVSVCTQHARTILDDKDTVLEALSRREKMIAIAAPAIVSSFPETYKRLLGWFKSQGVAAFFDVSFGAELTVKSYVDHIKDKSPDLVIAQPCPAIVTYVETYRPELLRYMAPADSPMLHTVKMIREYYPQFRDHTILALSPCAAKRREFDETGLADYNLTFRSLETLLKEKGVDLKLQPEADFENPSAERAVGFSTPGGLLQTAAREVPGIESKTRRIEGPALIYPYLDGLLESLERGYSPLLVDCLNCEYGCNAGTGTVNQGRSPDELERPIERLSSEGKARYGGTSDPSAAKRRLGKVLSSYWKTGLYRRTYVDRSENYTLRMPTESQLQVIYASMLKDGLEDHLNCAACGYKSCKGMAIAVFNDLNKKENCHLYRQRIIEREKTVIDDSTNRLHEEILRATEMVDAMQSSLFRLREQSSQQLTALEDSSAAMEQMIASLSGASGLASGKRDQMSRLSRDAQDSEREMGTIVGAMRAVSEGISGVGEMTSVIYDVADRTNLLGMNAAIQAAHAGTAGRGFAVVAGEIRNLAEATAQNASRISASLKEIFDHIGKSDKITEAAGRSIQTFSGNVSAMAVEISSLIESLEEMSQGGAKISQNIQDLRGLSQGVKDQYEEMEKVAGAALRKIEEIASISDEAQKAIAAMIR